MGSWIAAWTCTLDAPATASPLVGEGLVLVERIQDLVALDADSGQERWRYPVPEGRQLLWARTATHGLWLCSGKDRLWRLSKLGLDGQTRWSGLIEAEGLEAVTVGERLWLLASDPQGGSCLRCFAADGTMEGLWPVPPGGRSLCAQRDRLLFVVENMDEAGLFAFADGTLLRLYSGELDSVRCSDEHILLIEKEEGFAVLDSQGRRLWRREDSNGRQSLGADVYTCISGEEGRRPSALDLQSGQLKWSIPHPKVGRHFRMVPLGAAVALYDRSDVALVAPANGKPLQTLECPSHFFSMPRPESCAHGLLALAERQHIHCYHWQA